MEYKNSTLNFNISNHIYKNETGKLHSKLCITFSYIIIYYIH